MAKRARAPLRIDLAGGWTDVPEFADAEGGAVVNVTLDKFVRGTLDDAGPLDYRHDVQAGGLGSSACELVLAEALRHPDADLDDIAEGAFHAERAAGVIGGRQDQYAACYGGLSFMAFRRPSAASGPVHIETHVRAAAQQPLAGVHAHAHSDLAAGRPRFRGQTALDGGRRCDCLRSAAEDDEERVALGPDLHPALL
ncbi:MAG: hypothetical protein WD359_05935, partial [Dehalococcoidia bacterium]